MKVRARLRAGAKIANGHHEVDRTSQRVLFFCDVTESRSAANRPLNPTPLAPFAFPQSPAWTRRRLARHPQPPLAVGFSSSRIVIVPLCKIHPLLRRNLSGPPQDCDLVCDRRDAGIFALVILVCIGGDRAAIGPGSEAASYVKQVARANGFRRCGKRLLVRLGGLGGNHINVVGDLHFLRSHAEYCEVADHQRRSTDCWLRDLRPLGLWLRWLFPRDLPFVARNPLHTSNRSSENSVDASR